MFYKKSVLKNFVKLTVENLCWIRTQVLFCQFSKIFKNTSFTKHIRWLLLPILKPLDSQRQWCKWISELLTVLLISTLSSNWHFCVYFRQAQAFRCITTASLTLDILYFFWQRRIEISWYLDHPIFFRANLYRNNHRITSILLSLRYIDLVKVEI